MEIAIVLVLVLSEHAAVGELRKSSSQGLLLSSAEILRGGLSPASSGKEIISAFVKKDCEVHVKW